jgi:hypothetical protein
VQVSIGNVVITVEDAPPRTRSAAPAPRAAGTGSDRLARHYIRGG